MYEYVQHTCKYMCALCNVRTTYIMYYTTPPMARQTYAVQLKNVYIPNKKHIPIIHNIVIIIMYARIMVR